MKKTLLILALGVLMCGCQSTSVKISGRLLGLGSKVVYLEKVTGGDVKLVDSVVLESTGDYRFELSDVVTLHCSTTLYIAVSAFRCCLRVVSV